MFMKARLVRIGNSKGLRIPKTLIEQSGLHDEVEITLKGDSLIIRPAANPREGWAEAFEEMARRSDDTLLDGDVPNEFDKREWEW
jgi:antitoxin MazE